MIIPEAFTFMGIDWKVKFEFPEGEQWGATVFRDSTILIRPDLSQQNKEASFIHELLHIAVWSSGWDRHFESDEEEKFVNAIANGIYAMIKERILVV